MKLIRKGALPLLVILASCMLLSACDLTEISFEAQSQNELVPSNITSNTSEAQTTVEPSQEVTTNPSQSNDPKIIGLEENLIIEIADYLKKLYVEYDMPEDSFAIKINKIKKDGAQPLHVKFDPNNYYYACAYYNPTHENPDYEKFDFCCVNDYTWVKFDTADQITDQYQGLAFVCAFQVNRTAFCHDIGLTGGISTDMEHYAQYKPQFVNGSNVADAAVFDECFIYLNSSDLKTVYCTVDRQYHNQIAMPCMEFDGQYYVPYYMHTKYADGTIGESDLEWHFGEYYEYVMSIMLTDKYTEQNRNGDTHYYGLISVEEIAKIISE